MEGDLMRALRGLIVDNEPRNSAAIQRSLRHEFELLGVEIIWHLEDDSIEACQIIRRSAAFDFAVVDLYYPPDGPYPGRSSDVQEEVPDGFRVLKELYRRDRRTFSVLVTSYASLMPAFRDEAEEYCKKAMVRDELLRSSVWGFSSLAKKIHENAFFSGLVEGKTADLDTEADVLAMVEDVGHSVAPDIQSHGNEDSFRDTGARVIRNLVMRCLPTEFREDIGVRIGYVPSGRSGSRVCRVEVTLPGEPTQAYILKFGLDKNALERELNANKEVLKYLSEQRVVPLMGKVETEEISGYHAVIMRVAQDSVTLDEWLLRKASNIVALRVARDLLGELLKPLFEQSERRQEETRAWLAPTVSEVVRAAETLARFEPVLADSRTGTKRSTRREFRVLRALLEDPSSFIGSFAHTLPEQVHFVRSFGDLHCRNVLVLGNANPKPLLIDASLHGLRHWASDTARLIVDLFLRVRCPAVESMFWSDLGDSILAGERLCPHGYGRPSPDANPVEVFLATAVLNAKDFTNAKGLRLLFDEWHWQWHTALAKEFLRQSSHADLTPPRAALALLLAARHLRWSVVLLRRASGR
jgi:CheY-like chemotaxis protein